MTGKRRRAPAYMSRPRKEQLIQFVAGSGENYDRYLMWVAANPDVKAYTPYYFHVWVQRHRFQIQMARGYMREFIANMSTLDKQARIKALEETVARLDVLLSYAPPIETQLKIEEQLRKTLESIAKERGEFNAPPEEKKPDTIGAALAGLLRNAKEAKVSPLPQPPMLPSPVVINAPEQVDAQEPDDE